MQFTSTTRVQPAQVDELGHLNHVFAVEILQSARDDWYREAGLWEGRPWSGDENLGTLVLNINVNYRAECFLDEVLKVVTRPLYRGNKSYTLAQEIIKPDGQVAIDATVTSLVMDMQHRRTLQVPECLGRYFQPRDRNAQSGS